MAVSFKSFDTILRELGRRAQQLRLMRNETQDELASRAGVGVKALRRLEGAGRGTLETALRVASVLGSAEGFERLFELPPVATLADLEHEEVLTKRRRARRRA